VILLVGSFLCTVLFVPMFNSGLRVLGLRVSLGLFGFLLVGSFFQAVLFVPMYVWVPYAFYKIYYL